MWFPCIGSHVLVPVYVFPCVGFRAIGSRALVSVCWFPCIGYCVLVPVNWFPCGGSSVLVPVYHVSLSLAPRKIDRTFSHELFREKIYKGYNSFANSSTLCQQRVLRSNMFKGKRLRNV